MNAVTGPVTPQPLLALSNICRHYGAGEQTVCVLDDINLRIEAGEMVAIVGPSGSGKSTLMHIIGCLDLPSGGDYQLNGVSVPALDADALAQVRRRHFGFIFQRYHLLADLSARANTEMPAIYAGLPAVQRRAHATALLSRLGLGDRLHYRPPQLSGGQQQRVAIARALINGAGIILADEPTGALDSQHGKEVMKLLAELNAGGQTVIIVTHDLQVAEHARRIIEMRDGRIVADRQTAKASAAVVATVPLRTATRLAPSNWCSRRDRLCEGASMAWRAMRAHRLRTLLTMMGIIIGIASVVSVTAVGEGARQKVERELAALGTNTLEIYSGEDLGPATSAGVARLTPADADAIGLEPAVDSVAPTAVATVLVRYANIRSETQISGVGEQYFRAKGMEVVAGQIFSRDSMRRYALEAVIDQRTASKLFGPAGKPVGKVMLVGRAPVRVVAVVRGGENLSTAPDSLKVWLPYTTLQGRIAGAGAVQSILVRLRDTLSPQAERVALAAVTQLLRQRHTGRTFQISGNHVLRETVTGANRALSLLITSMAMISLLVGGIGVMNIMLVSVTERTAEIGIRMAVGARQGDIRLQFLLESVMVCLLGGVIGILLSFGAGYCIEYVNEEINMVFSMSAIAAAFATCTLVGVLFGFVPARNAARLSPVLALTRHT